MEQLSHEMIAGIAFGTFAGIVVGLGWFLSWQSMNNATQRCRQIERQTQKLQDLVRSFTRKSNEKQP